MFKNFRISYNYAFFSNPVVSQGKIDIPEGADYHSQEFDIPKDHLTIIVKKYDNKQCQVELYKKPMFFAKFLERLGNYLYKHFHFSVTESIETKKVFPLNRVLSVSYDDGWDDSCTSFKQIEASEVILGNRIRHIFDEKQILSSDQLVRGKVVEYHTSLDYKKILILEGESLENHIHSPQIISLFLYEDGSTKKYALFLTDCSVIPDENGFYNNFNYLVDTGETMTEAQIQDTLSRKKN
jgi:hypothetical protein